MVQDVARFLAELLNIPLPVICSQTVLNSKKLLQMLNLSFLFCFVLFFLFF